MELTLNISRDGKVLSGLYSDFFPYRELGDIEVTRASEVFFNADTQMWRIEILDEKKVLPKEFLTRAEAIRYEVNYLNNRE